MPRQLAIVALAALFDEAFEMKILIGKRMRQLMNQRGLLHGRRSPVGQIQALLVIVVKCRGLLCKQINCGFLEIKILRNKAEFF